MPATLGQAYVQIIPSANGIGGKIQAALSGSDVTSAGTVAGQGIGKKIIAAVAGLGIGAAIGKTIQSSISEGAALEQSIGGVETLFKKSADIVKKNAEVAYKTAGLSANAYMEQATSFSASLLQSLGGDTEKAAQFADRAMRDMSDNANKMGTNIAMISGTYQSLARGNFVMLDNLKLGYGGTKTEMKRLIEDTSKMTGIQKELGVTVKEGDMSFGNMINAISVMQQKLGITGTTAEEAEKTFTGSFTAMKAASSNLFASMALGDDVKPKLEALGTTFKTFFVDNFLRMVGNVVKQVPTLLSTAFSGITNALPDISGAGKKLLDNLTKSISSEGGGKMISSAIAMVGKFADAFGKNVGPLLASAGKLVATLAVTLVKHIPEMLVVGAKIVGAILTGIGSALGGIAEVAQGLLDKANTAISTFAQTKLKPAGEKIIKAISTAVKSKFQEITKAVTDKMKSVRLAIVNAWTNIKSTFTGAISNIVSKVSSGFSNVKNKISSTISAAKDKVKTVVTNIKTALGFSGLAGKVAEVFNSIKKKISEPIEKAKGLVKGAIDKIKGFFPLKIGKIFSGLKLPHFNISAGKAPFGLGGKGEKPSIGVSWYKKAEDNPYMFKDATLFGAGEHNDEILYGRTALLKDIETASSKASKPMNVTNYITVNGAEDPEDWASRFARQMKLEARLA